MLIGSRRKTKWLPVSNKVTHKQVKLLFGPLACVVYSKTIIHLSVGESGGYLHRRFATW